MADIYIQIAIIGVFAFLVTSEALYIMKTRKRIVELEKALGSEKLLSIDEAKLPSRMHKEMLASLEWLKKLQYQIPTMKRSTLETIKEELADTHEMYCEAFGKDLIENVKGQYELELKKALLLQIEITIGWVEREVDAKSS